MLSFKEEMLLSISPNAVFLSDIDELYAFTASCLSLSREVFLESASLSLVLMIS